MKKNSFLDTVVYALTIVIIFTLLDGIFHFFVSGYHVPATYFINKIWAGFILAVIALYVAQITKNWFLKSLILASIITFPLQLRYVFLYGIEWNLVVMALHFSILYIIGLVYFKLHD